MKGVLRASDTVARFGAGEFTLARFGGDEFVVLCEDLASEGDAVRVAERIQQALLSPFVLERSEHVVTASIGIVVASGANCDAESLLRDADIAMYRAKELGPGRWEVFDEVIRNRALERVGIERELRRALELGELRLHYQPVVKLDDGALQSVEALVRWQHPERGLVPPGDFIPIAEESGLILQIGAWTLREACEQACRWRAEFGDRAPLPVSVNVSARQLAQPELPEIVGRVLRQTGMSAGDLAIEVTESALIEDSSVAAASLRELKVLGVRILLDDFGTGYSSLSHLQQFPIDALKIDRSFVMHLGKGERRMRDRARDRGDGGCARPRRRGGGGGDARAGERRRGRWAAAGRRGTTSPAPRHPPRSSRLLRSGTGADAETAPARLESGTCRPATSRSPTPARTSRT